MENNFLNFKKKSETETELYVYGNIEKKDWIDNWLGTGKEKTDAFTLKDALMQVDTPNLTVRINSYGGSVSEGLAIYSLLSEFKGHLKTIVDGFACSAASVIFMAGDERVMSTASLLMIHNAWTWASGNAKELRKQADDLDTVTQASINAYMQEVNITEEELKQMLDDETWIAPQEALEKGFITTIVNEKDAEEISQSVKKSLIDIIIKSKKDDDNKKKCEETKKFKCLECDYIYEGTEKPDKCPECGSTEFIEIIDDDMDEAKESCIDSFFNLMRKGE